MCTDGVQADLGPLGREESDRYDILQITANLLRNNLKTTEKKF